MNKRIKYSVWMLLVVVCCSKKVDYITFMDNYDNKEHIFHSNTRISYRGKDEDKNNLFAYHLKINDSTSVFSGIRYRTDTISFVHLSLLESKIIDIAQIKKECNFLQKFKVKSLHFDEKKIVKFNLDDDDSFDLIKVYDQSTLNEYQRSTYTKIREKWYLTND